MITWEFNILKIHLTKYELQDCNVSLFVCEQIEQFWVEMKEENNGFQTKQKWIQKMMMIQLYKQFELMYSNTKYFFLENIGIVIYISESMRMLINCDFAVADK